VDAAGTLETAAQLLSSTRSGDEDVRRELVIVSDFQRGNWAKADFSALPQGVQIQLESAAPAQTLENLAILAATATAASGHDGGVRWEVELGNFTPAARTVTLEVVAGRSTRRHDVVCPPHGSITVSDHLDLPTVGWLSGRATLVGVEDALIADNARPFVVRVPRPPVYVLVTRQSSRERPSSSHFIECAIVPDVAQRQDNSARLLRLDSAEADATTLGSADVIVLDHPGKLEEETIGVLAGLLRRGRPIVYVAAEPADAINLRHLSQVAGGGLQLPVEFAPPPLGTSRRSRLLANVADENPVFAVFGDQLNTLISGLRFTGGLTSRRIEQGLPEDILATYDDGSAFLVVTASDAGALAVINADLVGANLPRSPSFVPMIEELVGQVVHRNRNDDVAYCGEPLVVRLQTSVETSTDLTIAGPELPGQGLDQQRLGQQRLGELVDEPTGVTWRWLDPDRLGVYRVCRGDETVFAKAIGLAVEECSLASLPGEVLVDRLGAGCEIVYLTDSGQHNPSDDFWKWCVVACVLCMTAERLALIGFRA
jgi:hypothetical protein